MSAFGKLRIQELKFKDGNQLAPRVGWSYPSEKGRITIKVFYSFIFMLYIYNENRKAVGQPDMSFILSEVLHFNLINSINKRTKANILLCF